MCGNKRLPQGEITIEFENSQPIEQKIYMHELLDVKPSLISNYSFLSTHV